MHVGPHVNRKHRGVSDRKVAGSRFDSRAGHSLLCPWETRLTHPLAPGSLPVVVAPPNERLANRTPNSVLCIGVVKQTQKAWFMCMNNWKTTAAYCLDESAPFEELNTFQGFRLGARLHPSNLMLVRSLQVQN